MKVAQPKALILVVEDNEDVRNIITLYLRRNGYAIAEAADGLAGVDAVASVKPDLVLLDVLLPRLDGSRDRAALADWLEGEVKAGRVTMPKDAREQAQEVGSRAALEALVEARLAAVADLALLRD